MARTIVNGVSNNARVETIVQNSDAIDGVKFVGTLDGKTCPYCASYDGYIWRGEEIAEARRPPIHPNCRCCLIPYVELKDEEGNVIDVDGERPAANADFDKLAQDAYNERAREKGWKRRWYDLSPSTRLKYYYQAQKDFEAETGKPAYRQVSGSTTFQEYFHRQPDSFKRAWLGAKRYELYKSGKLKEKNIFKPDLTYQVSVESLVRDGVRSIAQETIEKAVDNDIEFIRIDDRSLIEVLRDNPEEKMLPIEDIEQNFFERRESEFIDGYKEQDTTKKAEIFIKEKFDIDADYSIIPLDVANMMNRELVRARNIFGTCGLIEKIIPNDGSLGDKDYGLYRRGTRTIVLRTDKGVVSTNMSIIKECGRGWFSTENPAHVYTHEICHAIFNYFENIWTNKANTAYSVLSVRGRKAMDALEKLHNDYFLNREEKGVGELSRYAAKNAREMIAEGLTQIVLGKPSAFAQKIRDVIQGA